MKHGDIVWVRLPARGGREQAGTRPAILMQLDEGADRCPTLVVVPLTAQLAATRFPHTVELEPAPGTGLRVTSVALVFQITVLDRLNILEQLGTLPAKDLERVTGAVVQMVTPKTQS